MLGYLVRRIVVAFLVAVTVSIIGFSLLRLSGDLASVLAGENATQEQIARIATDYGLDRPFYVQYFDWVGRALQGDLGRSLFTHEPVTQMIMERIGVTTTLAVASLLLALLIAVPLGIIAAMKANTWVDRTALLVAVSGQATPNFWLALIFILVFAVNLRWLPVSGSGTIWHFVMPVMTLGFSIMPSIMRLTRTGMLEVLSTDYIRTARAKGLSPWKVMFKHALRNAILPVVSLAAVQLGFLLGGSVIVESIFALNGIGYLAFQSIVRIDFPVVQSILVFLACAYIVLTLISDLINAKLDPRVRLH